jgi:hypothetical protein
MHHVLEIRDHRYPKPLYLNQEEGDDTLIFRVVDNGDGTFLFTATLETPSDFTAGNEEMDEFMPMDPQSLSFILQDSTITWQLSVAELIEADPIAEFDPASKIITWEIPISDVLLAEENLDIFAIYRTEGSQTVIEPEPEETPTPTLGPEYKEEATPTSIPNATESPIRPTVDLDFEGAPQRFPGAAKLGAAGAGRRAVPGRDRGRDRSRGDLFGHPEQKARTHRLKTRWAEISPSGVKLEISNRH